MLTNHERLTFTGTGPLGDYTIKVGLPKTKGHPATGLTKRLTRRLGRLLSILSTSQLQQFGYSSFPLHCYNFIVFSICASCIPGAYSSVLSRMCYNDTASTNLLYQSQPRMGAHQSTFPPPYLQPQPRRHDPGRAGSHSHAGRMSAREGLVIWWERNICNLFAYIKIQICNGIKKIILLSKIIPKIILFLILFIFNVNLI